MKIAGKEANVWTVLAVLILGCAAILMWRVLVWERPLEVTVVNTTSGAISGLALAAASGQHTAVPRIAAGSSATVRPLLGSGEGRLALVDEEGRDYTLIDRLHGDPGGSVTVIVDSVSSSGLAGSVEGSSAYFPKGQSKLEPSN